jgi:hypothetical protein
LFHGGEELVAVLGDALDDAVAEAGDAVGGEEGADQGHGAELFDLLL